jgi:hypothetical protein
MGGCASRYAVSVAVSYSADHEAILSMAKTACLYLTCEALVAAARQQGIAAVEAWDACRLDMRPVYGAALWLYLLYALAHQAYTLHHLRKIMIIIGTLD